MGSRVGVGDWVVNCRSELLPLSSGQIICSRTRFGHASGWLFSPSSVKSPVVVAKATRLPDLHSWLGGPCRKVTLKAVGQTFCSSFIKSHFMLMSFRHNFMGEAMFLFSLPLILFTILSSLSIIGWTVAVAALPVAMDIPGLSGNEHSKASKHRRKK